MNEISLNDPLKCSFDKKSKKWGNYKFGAHISFCDLLWPPSNQGCLIFGHETYVT